MACQSDFSVLSSDDFPTNMSSMTSSLDRLSKHDDISSKDKHLTELIPSPKSESDEMDNLIQKRIKKIYKRLKETDQNIKTMETLLGRKSNRHHRSYTPKKINTKYNYTVTQRARSRLQSNPSQSLLDLHDTVVANSNDRELGRSLEDFQATEESKTAMSEQLRRLTQSMQDLHNYQRRAQAEWNENHPTVSKSRPVEPSLPREVVENLRTVEDDAKISQIGSLIHTFQQNVSELKSHQLDLVSTIQTLTKQFEGHTCQSQPSFAREYPNQNELHEFQENIQHQIRETIKTSKEISSHVERVFGELQHLNHITSENKMDSRSAHKKSKRMIQKLKIQGETLMLEKKHFEDTSHILEDKCRALALEKELLLRQLDECQNKVAVLLQEEEMIKAKFVEEQIQNVKKDSTLEYIKMLHEDTKKKLSNYEVQIEKLKFANEKYAHENESLARKIQDLRNEASLHQHKCNETAHSPEHHENLLSNLNDYKLQFSKLEMHKNDLSKKLNEQLESNKKLLDSLAEMKATTNLQIADISKRKEVEMNSVITLLKEQVADYQTHIKLLQQENKNIAEKNSYLSTDIMKIHNEVRDMHRKNGSLLKSVYSKEEELKLKSHQMGHLEENMNEFRTICRKMEHEYKAFLTSINAEVDHTLQLWNSISSYTPQALSQGTGTVFHPKIHFVDIISKLKWMQDDLQSRVNKLHIEHIDSHYPVRDSEGSNPEYRNLKTAKSQLNILGNFINSDTTNEKLRKPDVSEETNTYTSTMLNCNLKQSWDFSNISKNHPADFFENFASSSGKKSKVTNDYKRLNSTEIGHGDAHINNSQEGRLKSNNENNMANTSSPVLSSISEPSTNSPSVDDDDDISD